LQGTGTREQKKKAKSSENSSTETQFAECKRTLCLLKKHYRH